ncbi:MAG: hypothetical protein A3F70_18455 [Acidobacteria bacterium RIFCSPLOWO2_12_FULL_67_14]|nr:MAG: hypothetical protein A3F70_18455 [Acidobacteria bacterium RIFCSPLOWO2_12_FULL_67_14]
MSDGAPAGDVCWPALAVLEPAAATRRLMFVDLETTGLAGGAGTYAFLVGCGWFDRGAFRVRQLLLAGYAAERALLGEVARIAGDSALGTYNGKTFDLPLIESRFLLHRMTPPFENLPHIDMLYPARRLWGGSGGSAGRWAESSAESAPHARSPDPPHVRGAGAAEDSAHRPVCGADSAEDSAHRPADPPLPPHSRRAGYSMSMCGRFSNGGVIRCRRNRDSMSGRSNVLPL